MQIMPAPVKLYSELIIKVSFPSCTPPHPSLQYSKYCCGEEEEVGGSWIPQVGQDQNKEGCSVETELVRVWRGEAGSLMPGVDGCFCLVVRGGGGLASVSQTGNSSPVRKTRGRRAVSSSSNIVLL